MEPQVFVKKINGKRIVVDENDNEINDYYKVDNIEIVYEDRQAEQITRPCCSDTQEFPPLRQQLKGFVSSVSEWVKAGCPLSEDQEQRWAICEQCSDLVKGRCLHCGCMMRGKIYLETAHCYLDKW